MVPTSSKELRFSGIPQPDLLPDCSSSDYPPHMPVWLKTDTATTDGDGDGGLKGGKIFARVLPSVHFFGRLTRPTSNVKLLTFGRGAIATEMISMVAAQASGSRK
jgi:hypothetical protein